MGGLSNLTLITSSNTQTTYDVGEYKLVILYCAMNSDNWTVNYLKTTGCTALVTKNQINQTDWYKAVLWIWKVDSKDATVCPYLKIGSGSLTGLYLYGIK